MMNVIYKPSGRALDHLHALGVEEPLACNLWRGCDHGCTYCYGPSVLRMTAEQYHNNPQPKKDIVARLEQSALARQRKGLGGQVLLCFVGDPYCKADIPLALSRQAISILHDTGHPINILTKGGHRAMRDLDLIQPGDWFGTSLTCLYDQWSLDWEPDAALPGDRIATMRAFRAAGAIVWASMEPVLVPRQTLALIDIVHPFVDHFVVGKLNYHPLAREIDWQKFAHEAVELLERLGASYTLKPDLAAYLEAVREVELLKHLSTSSALKPDLAAYLEEEWPMKCILCEQPRPDYSTYVTFYITEPRPDRPPVKRGCHHLYVRVHMDCLIAKGGTRWTDYETPQVTTTLMQHLARDNQTLEQYRAIYHTDLNIFFRDWWHLAEEIAHLRSLVFHAWQAKLDLTETANSLGVYFPSCSYELLDVLRPVDTLVALRRLQREIAEQAPHLEYSQARLCL
jgi:hypothetical protein